MAWPPLPKVARAARCWPACASSTTKPSSRAWAAAWLCWACSTSASPVLTGVTFYSNTAAIGEAMLVVAVSNSVSSPVLNNVIFDANAGAVGGAMANVGHSTGTALTTLADVLFSNNRGFIDGAFRVTLDRNTNGNPGHGCLRRRPRQCGHHWLGAVGLTMTGTTLQNNRRHGRRIRQRRRRHRVSPPRRCETPS